MCIRRYDERAENQGDNMANVFIEPKPPGGGNPPDHYVIEHANGTALDGVRYKRQEDAIKAARGAGHHPLVARVRNTNKGNPDHWRSAD
jgi:hypothetical protein